MTSKRLFAAARALGRVHRSEDASADFHELAAALTDAEYARFRNTHRTDPALIRAAICGQIDPPEVEDEPAPLNHFRLARELGLSAARRDPSLVQRIVAERDLAEQAALACDLEHDRDVAAQFYRGLSEGRKGRLGRKTQAAKVNQCVSATLSGHPAVASNNPFRKWTPAARAPP